MDRKGRHVGKRQVPLPSFYDGMKRSLMPTQGQEIASGDIFESLLIHTAMEGVSKEGAGSVTQVPLRRESGRMTLGGHQRSHDLWPGELGCLVPTLGVPCTVVPEGPCHQS